MTPAAERYLSRNRDSFHAWADAHLSSAPMAASEPESAPVKVMPLRPAPTPGPDPKLSFPSAPAKPWNRPFLQRPRRS